MSAEEQLAQISDVTHEIVNDQYVVLNEMLWPSLRAEGIYFLRREEWNNEQRQWVDEYFKEELAPILSPMGLDPSPSISKGVEQELELHCHA